MTATNKERGQQQIMEDARLAERLQEQEDFQGAAAMQQTELAGQVPTAPAMLGHPGGHQAGSHDGTQGHSANSWQGHNYGNHWGGQDHSSGSWTAGPVARA